MSAETKLELLGLIDGAVAAGWPHARACRVLDLADSRAHHWRQRLRENRLGEIVPEAPVLLHHARRDQIVSFEQSVKLRDRWERIGADVRLYVTRGGVDHVSGGVAGMPVALGWIAGRLRRRGAGVPVSPPVPVVVAEQAA